MRFLDQIPEDASFINGVKELIMADDVQNYYSTEFTNGGFPTSLKEVSSQLVTGPTDSDLNDILADHTTDEILTNSIFSEEEPLGGSALKKWISVLISCELESAPEGTTVTLKQDQIEDSPYIDFDDKILF